MPLSTEDAEMGRESAFSVSAATLEALEFQSLLALLAELAATDLGREKILELRPFQSREDWDIRRGLLQEASVLLEEKVLLPGGHEPFLPALERIRGSREQVEGRDVRVVGDLLDSVVSVGQVLSEADPPLPELAALVQGVPSGRELLRRIRKTLNRRGEVKEDASPLLSRLRREARRRRDRLYGQLQGVVGERREELSEETITLASGRLVVLLKAGAKGRMKGLVHGRSGSGQSYYFEPLEVVDGNNHLQEAASEAEAEERRILNALLGELADAWDVVESHASILGLLDLIQASCRFAALTGAVIPELSEGPALRLVQSRHPLLDPRLADLRDAALGQGGHREDVVPLDVELGGDCRGLVITGPNAGGKTVVLKTLGLAALCAQSGLPVSGEEGTSLPFLRSVVASVGDEQDLLEERSTFSGRLLRINEALDGSGPGSLVLLDEVGSGTDPDEGAALGSAVLETLVERGGLTLMTSHLVQLAAFALELESAGCGAMECDPRDGSPRYRLLPGPPGASQAIALARRLGVDREVLARAENRLGGEQREFRRLLTEVEMARDELAEERGRLQDERENMILVRDKLSRERQAAEAERREERERVRRELESFRVEVRRKLKDEKAKIRRQLEAGRKKGLASGATNRLFESAPELSAPSEPTRSHSQDLGKGARVRNQSWGWEGEVLSQNRDRATVLVSGKRIQCSVEELVVLKSQNEPGKRPAPVVSVDSQRQAEQEVNLIGRRVDPALEALDDFLDRALLGSLHEVRVIHGHGSGRLRKAVRAFLAKHPAVARARPGGDGEGGDGATVVKLRER